jgi:hypothetical protein
MKHILQSHLNENLKQFLQNPVLLPLYSQIKLVILLLILLKMKIQSNDLLLNVKNDGRKTVKKCLLP